MFTAITGGFIKVNNGIFWNLLYLLMGVNITFLFHRFTVTSILDLSD